MYQMHKAYSTRALEKHLKIWMLDTSPPCHFAPISKFANSKFKIFIGHALTLILKALTLILTLNPQTKIVIPNLKSV